MTITVHESQPAPVGYVQVGAVARGGSFSNVYENATRICLQREGPHFVYTMGGLSIINYGLCRLEKGHVGDHASVVFTCDVCDRTFPGDAPFGDQDIDMCEECHG